MLKTLLATIALAMTMLFTPAPVDSARAAPAVSAAIAKPGLPVEEVRHRRRYRRVVYFVPRRVYRRAFVRRYYVRRPVFVRRYYVRRYRRW